jgi:quercetin dioxygenase-like cupin family protein
MDITQLNNEKYLVGKYADFKESRGWFVGSFFDEKHPCKTDKVEVQYAEQKAGHVCKKHYHQQKVEIILILAGRVVYIINDKKVEVRGGDFLFVDINNVVLGEFIEDTKYFSIHAPSIIDDKVRVE